MVCDVDTKNLEKIMDKYRIDRTAFMWLQPTGDRPIDTLGDLDAEQTLSLIHISEPTRPY